MFPMTFLGAVAAAYAARYDEMSDFCFVFPNKRSSTFFLKILSRSLPGDRPILAPETLDIESFVSRVSGLEGASRLDMLFRLYKVYCSLLGRSGSLEAEEDVIAFDRFAPWGDTLLGDFSEVDKYCVDAAELFRNVRDYRSIASNFLTEEQLDVIERYFGYRPAAGDVEGFWKAVYDPDELSRLRSKFVELWKLLPELYAGLRADLEAERLALPGTLFRRAAARVAEEGRAALPWSKVVVVGFNMISTAEADLFAAMRDLRDDDGEPFAEFFWDATGPVLGVDRKLTGPATRAIHRNISLFPAPEWARPFLNASMRSRMPAITFAAAPSNAAQTKVAADTLREWIAAYDLRRVASPRTAVVIPDENLLMPLIHSIPGEIVDVNLTMGHSLRFTSVASFVGHLKRLQSRRRKSGGAVGYLSQDMQVFLAHPLVHLLVGTDTAARLNGDIARFHLRVVTLLWIKEYSPELADILEPIPADAPADAVVDYLNRVLDRIDARLAPTQVSRSSQDSRDSQDSQDPPRPSQAFNSRLERSLIASYRLAMSRLLAGVHRHAISMSWLTVFHLIDRLLAGETLALEGKPLRGLQVMGLLETRALDFDRIIILSMNDKVMPRRSRKRTFIPDTLRRGYGMPLASQGEELYSYYFYRLISRAREVVLVYDARAGEGMRSGGKSRFLMQLDLLYAPGATRTRAYGFRLDAHPELPTSVTKSPEVLERLREFTIPAPDGRNLSASALMNYCACPVKFYYKNVAALGDDSPEQAAISPIAQGNIVHRAMLWLYFPEGKRERYLRPHERITLTAADLDALLADEERVRRAVFRAVNKEHHALRDDDLDRPLIRSVQMIADRLVQQVRDVIAHDRSIAPLTLVGGEMRGHERLRIGEAPEVNVSYAFDRVDIIGGRVRIVDYKTGKSGVFARKPEDIFNGEPEAKYIIQLLLYAHLLADFLRKEEGRDPGDIGLHIYDVNIIGDAGSVRPVVAKTLIDAHTQLDSLFTPGLERLLLDLFDPAIPFLPADDSPACLHCAYTALCRR